MKKILYVLSSTFLFFFFLFGAGSVEAQCFPGFGCTPGNTPPPTPSAFTSNTVQINTTIPGGGVLNAFSNGNANAVLSSTVASGITGVTAGSTSNFSNFTITNPYNGVQVSNGAYTTVTNPTTGEVNIIVVGYDGGSVFNVCVTGCGDGGGSSSQGMIYTTPVINWVVANGQQDYYATKGQTPPINADIWVGHATTQGVFAGTEYTGNGTISLNQVGNGANVVWNIYGVDQPWCHITPSAGNFIDGHSAVVNLDAISDPGDYTCNMTIGGGSQPVPQIFTIHYHVLDVNNGACDQTAVGDNKLMGCIYGVTYPGNYNYSTIYNSGSSLGMGSQPSWWAPNQPSTPDSDTANAIPFVDWYNMSPNLIMNGGNPGGYYGGYAIRWKSTYTFTGGQYTFTWGSASGIRVFIDNNNDNLPDDNTYLVNDWAPHYAYPNPVKTQAVTLPAGKNQIDVEYNTTGGLGFFTNNFQTMVPYGQSVSLSWAPAVSGGPFVTLSADPTAVNSGSASTLTWTVTGSATSCTGSANMPVGNWSSGNSGSVSTGALVSTQDYSLTCTGPGGTGNTATVRVNLNAGAACSSPSVGTNRFIGCQFNSIDLSGPDYRAAPSQPVVSNPADNVTPLPDSGNLGGGSSGLNGLVYSYSIRFKGTFNFTGGTYAFTHGSDDGFRVYIDDNNDNIPDSGYLVNDWNFQGYYIHPTDTATISAGQHQIDADFFQGPDGAAEYSLSWAKVVAQGAVNGACGTANKAYINGSSSYGADTYCSAGTPTATPAFPSAGSSVNWSCSGSNGGTSSGTCVASQASGSGSTCTLTVVKTIGGSVANSNSAISCGTNCSMTVSCTTGNTTTLTATPNSAYWKFTGWTGDCSGSNPSVFITVNRAKTCTANFVPQPFQYQEF